MSNQINDGGPAFPCVYYSEPIGSIGSQLTIKGGLSIRDYFAAAALQGFCANQNSFPTTTTHFSNIADDSFKAADEMLKAREVKP